MKEQTYKPVMHNSYKCDDTVVRVNEYSTISAEWVSQMVSVDFPVHYNCIVVKLSSSQDSLERILEDFVEYADNVFSVVLIQRVGVKDAVVNVFSPRDMFFIHSKLFDFDCSYSSDDFKMQY